MENELAGRLLIEKVVLKNFKSYAGEKVIGPFHKNLTSVVGPNGSGKSNLLESLLFAFGKRARKMRLKKLAELIHHSDAYPNLSEASVEVHFVNIIDTGESYEVVPNSSLILARIVKKNSTSEYRLNGRASSFEEVTNTLKARGIDLEHNRFLILQGEVEQIAMMKPKSVPGEESKSGLLEYLEEIIGTDKYVPQIEETEKELEKIADDVATKKLRFEESKKAVEVLEEPMKEAVSYIELEKELYCFKSLKVRLEIFQKVLQVRKIQDELSVENAKYAELKAKIEKKKKDNEESILEFQRKAEEIKKLNEIVKTLQNELQKIVEEDSKVSEELKIAKTKLRESAEEAEKNSKRSEECSKEIEHINIQMPGLETKLQEINEERTRIEAQFNEIKAQVQAKTEQLQTKKSNLEKELNPHKRSLTKIKSEKDSKEQELKTLQSDLANGEEEKEKLQKDLVSLSRDSEKYEKEIHDLSQSAKTAKDDSNSLIEGIEKIQTQIDSAKIKSAEINSLIRQIESEERKSVEAKGQINEILRGKMEKVLTGVHGRLGDLGSIDAIYDVAASNSCTRLDNIVVESVSDGNKVIDFCRSRNLGKVVLIVLEKIKIDKAAMNNFRSPDAKAVRLFDKINFSDQRFRDVFYFAFGNTLCTDSLEDARRIAFGEQRFRVVTKTGDIIDPSGEMRGFVRPLKGKIKTGGSFKAEMLNLADLQKELKANSDLIIKLEQNKKETEQQLEKLRLAERTANQDLKKKQQELKLSKDKVLAAQNRLEVINSRSVEKMENETRTIEKIIQEMQKSFEKTEQLISQKKAEINEVDREIEKIAGEEFKIMKENLAKIVEEEEKTESEVLKNRSKLNQKGKDIEKYQKIKEKAEAQVKYLTSEIERFKEAKVQLRKRGEEIAGEYHKGEQNLEEGKKMMIELEREKVQISREFEELHNEISRVKEREADLKRRSETYKNEIALDEAQLNHIVTEYQNLEAEYSGLLDNMEVESQQVQVLDHQSRKQKFFEDRLNLKKPVFWNPSEEEIQFILPKIRTVDEIKNILEQELSSSTPNLKIIDEYKLKKADKLEKENILNEIKLKESELRSLYTDIKSKRLNEFTKGFREISDKLRCMYDLLTRGGSAELEFADSTDPFSEGIVFTVRPPSKSWKKMANLSGGEKTLSSLSLVFALHHYKPNALYVMDEVDAALDFQNVGVIANYIKGETKNAQFIVVSLRYQMFEVADQLVGIYKVRDVSQSLSISPYALAMENSNNVIIQQTLENISHKNN